MADDIKIGVATDTRAFEQGTQRGVLKPLENIKDILEDVAREGDQAGNDIEDGMRHAQSATEKFKREIKEGTDALDAQGRAAKYAGADTKAAMQDSTNAAKGNVQELGNEAKANLAETLSSFDGTVEGTLSGIQGTLGGVTAGLSGIAPIAIAAAGAAGVGAIINAVSQASEESEEFKAKVSELASELIDAGEDGEVSMGYLVDKLKELATATEDGQTNLKDLKEASDESGSSFKELAQAYSGSTEDLEKLVKAGEDRVRQLELEAEGIDTTSSAEDGHYGKVMNKIAAQERYNTYVNEAKRIADSAAEADRNYALAGGPEMEQKAELIEAIDSAYDDAAAAVEDYIDKESGVFDVQGFIDSMNEREEALRNFQETLATSALSAEAKSFLVSQGQESASKFLQGYQAATPAQQSELNRIWSEGGRTSSGAYTRELRAGIPGSIPGPVVNGRVNMDRSELDRVLRGTYSVIVNTITKLGTKNP